MYRLRCRGEEGRRMIYTPFLSPIPLSSEEIFVLVPSINISPLIRFVSYWHPFLLVNLYLLLVSRQYAFSLELCHSYYLVTFSVSSLLHRFLFLPISFYRFSNFFSYLVIYVISSVSSAENGSWNSSSKCHFPHSSSIYVDSSNHQNSFDGSSHLTRYVVPPRLIVHFVGPCWSNSGLILSIDKLFVLTGSQLKNAPVRSRRSSFASSNGTVATHRWILYQ